MTMRFKLFVSAVVPWEVLCQQAADFASSIGRQNVHIITMAATELGGKGIITVWYWE